MHTSMHTYTCVYIYIYHTYTYVYRYVYIYTYHTYIYIYIYISPGGLPDRRALFRKLRDRRLPEAEVEDNIEKYDILSECIKCYLFYVT